MLASCLLEARISRCERGYLFLGGFRPCQNYFWEVFALVKIIREGSFGGLVDTTPPGCDHSGPDRADPPPPPEEGLIQRLHFHHPPGGRL